MVAQQIIISNVLIILEYSLIFCFYYFDVIIFKIIY